MRLGVVLDLDGTLVDSVYHHVLAWDRALAAHGHHVPLQRIHAGIGMGSSRLVPWLLGRTPDNIDAISNDHTRLFVEQGDRLRPTPGAHELLAACGHIDIEPRHAVLVGDSPWDVAAAARVGMQVITVRTGGFSDSALVARGPAAIVDAPADLIGTL